ncbi:MAG: hypothetical protein H5U40_02865 [Polyangiaceae bacterium]|nr:hypothetical protein [Polyangiaceae bacterium]
MSRRLGFCLLLAASLVGARGASAQDSDWETGDPAEQPVAQQGGAAQGEPQARTSQYGPTPLGTWFSGGLMATGGTGFYHRPWLRMEAGLPLNVGDRPGLSILLPLFYTGYGSIRTDFEGNQFGSRGSMLGFLPGVRYEWLVYEGYGAVTIYAEGGAGLYLEHLRVVDDFSGFDDRDTRILGGFRAAGGGTFTFPFGLTLSSQPAGLITAFGRGGGRAAYEFSLLVGYRLEG